MRPRCCSLEKNSCVGDKVTSSKQMQDLKAPLLNRAAKAYAKVRRSITLADTELFRYLGEEEEEDDQDLSYKDFVPGHASLVDPLVAVHGVFLYVFLPFTWYCGGDSLQQSLSQLSFFKTTHSLMRTGFHQNHRIGKTTLCFPPLVVTSLIVGYGDPDCTFPLSLLLWAPSLLLINSLVGACGLVYKGDHMRKNRFRRIKAMKEPLTFEFLWKLDTEVPTGSNLSDNYVEALSRGNILPADLLHQIAASGITYPPRFKWWETLPWMYERSGTFAIYAMYAGRQIFKIGVTLIPLLTINFAQASCGTFFCCIVFIFSVHVPHTSLRSVIDCLAVVRNELLHQATRIRLMQSMLASPRKWELLPRVRYNARSDLLAWFELHEYIEETHRTTFHFVLAQVGVIGVMIYIIALVTLLFIRTVLDEGSVQIHVAFFCLVAWISPFAGLATVNTILAGLSLNHEKDKLAKQLSFLVICQHKCVEYLTQIAQLDASHAKHEDFGEDCDIEGAVRLTSHIVSRMELVAADNGKVLGVAIDLKTTVAVVMMGCSMLGYVCNTSLLGAAFEGEFCKIGSHIPYVDFRMC